MKFIEFLKPINEKTLDIDSAVDYIFNKYYRDFFKVINKYTGATDSFPEKPGAAMLSSANLTKFSKDIKLAAEKKPVLISLNLGSGNAYQPDLRNNGGEIKIQLNKSFYEFISNYRHLVDNGGIKALGDLLSTKDKRAFLSDLSGDKVKASIAHELSHWVGDALHGDKIMKLLKKGTTRSVYQGHINVALTDYEVDAQIHQIKQLKRLHSDDWDMYSFEEMIALDGSLDTIYHNLTRKELIIWKKMLRKRLFREKLLGKRMNG